VSKHKAGPILHYWDSCMFLRFIKGSETDPNDVLRETMELVKQGKAKLVTSTLTIAEVVRPQRCNGTVLPSDEREIMNSLFIDDGIDLVDVIQPIALRAREIQWEVPGIKPFDSIHLATAEYAKVNCFDTFDAESIIKRVEKQPRFAWNHPFRIGMPEGIPQIKMHLNGKEVKKD